MNAATLLIFSVDKTAIYGNKMPPRTFITREEKSSFKASKDRLSVFLGANAEGNFKMKPVLSYHSENPRALKTYAQSIVPIL